MPSFSTEQLAADVSARLAPALAGRYSLGAPLGRGGAAFVFEATDLRHRRQVALKVLRPDLAEHAGGDRFLREIGIAARLSHPHILPLFDSGADGGFLWFSMPLMSGQTLRRRLEIEGALPVADAVVLAREVAGALAHAHGQGVIHRDIKPENILLQDGHAVVADFGIARAFAADDRPADTTGVGFVVGTPMYMSPEQAIAGHTVDARSDLYSLGCVLYEMLAGRPPFDAESAQVAMARHALDTPPSVRRWRDVPRALDEVVMRALAKDPDARFPDAASFAQSLAEAVSGTFPTIRTPASAARVLRRPWAPAAAVALGLALGVAIAVVRRPPVPPIDPSRILVMPFEHRGGAAPALLNGDECQALVRDRLERWQDVKVVSPMALQDRLARGEPPRGLRATLALARDLGAGQLVIGEVNEVGGRTIVRAELYDVAAGEASEAARRSRIIVPASADSTAVVFAALADTLLLGRADRGARPEDALGTTRLAAWRTYVRGMTDVAGWRVREARVRFDSALVLDADYPAAALRRAELGVWLLDPAQEWVPFVAIARRGASLLAEIDRDLVAGLESLGRGASAEACQHFRRAVTRDSLRFEGWLGLGDCLTSDSLVVPDRRSPSGFQFRSSFHEAAHAYRRAFALIPSSHLAMRDVVAARLRRTLMTSTHTLRYGRLALPDSAAFGAFPSLQADSLAFVPLPRLRALRPDALPATHREALRYAAAALDTITQGWVAAYPRSAVAWEARSRVLEGAQAERSGAGDLARSAMQQARTLTADTTLALRFAIDEVRLAIKAGDDARAFATADSLLVANPGARGQAAWQLLSLAALLGREQAIARLAAASGMAIELSDARGGLVTSVGAATLGTAAALMPLAILPGPAARLDSMAALVRVAIDREAPPAERPRTRAGLLALPRSYAAPRVLAAVGGDVPPATTQDELGVLLARGQRDSVRARLRTLWEKRVLLSRHAPGINPASLLVELQLLRASGGDALADSLAAAWNRERGWLRIDALDRAEDAAAVGVLVRGTGAR